MEEPESWDLPVDPREPPKHWRAPHWKPDVLKSADSPSRRSQIYRKVISVAERRLSTGLRRHKQNGAFWSGDDEIRWSKRRLTDHEMQQVDELPGMRRRSLFALSPRRSPLLQSVHTKKGIQPDEGSQIPSLIDVATQTDAVSTQDADAQTEAYLREMPKVEVRKPLACLEGKEEEDSDVVRVEGIRLSSNEETPLDTFPTGFVSMQRVATRGPPEKDKLEQLSMDRDAQADLLISLGKKLIRLAPPVRMRLAVAIMKTLATDRPDFENAA